MKTLEEEKNALLDYIEESIENQQAKKDASPDDRPLDRQMTSESLDQHNTEDRFKNMECKEETFGPPISVGRSDNEDINHMVLDLN